MIHDCFFQSIFNFASRWEVVLFHNSNDNDLDIEKDVFRLVTSVGRRENSESP